MNQAKHNKQETSFHVGWCHYNSHNASHHSQQNILLLFAFLKRYIYIHISEIMDNHASISLQFPLINPINNGIYKSNLIRTLARSSSSSVGSSISTFSLTPIRTRDDSVGTRHPICHLHTFFGVKHTPHRPITQSYHFANK